MHPLPNNAIAAMTTDFKRSIGAYAAKLLAQRYSGRRMFILRIMFADPNTLPAGKTRFGKEKPGKSLFSSTAPSSCFDRKHFN